MSRLLSSGSIAFRSLCWLLAVLMVASPTMPVLAQDSNKTRLADPAVVPAAAQLGLEAEGNFILPGACVVLKVRPRQLLTCEAAQMYPVEVVTAAGLKELGFDPVNVDQVQISATPPMGGPPNYAAVISFAEPIELAALSDKLTEHTVPAELDGKSYLMSQHPQLPSFYWSDETTLLVAPEQTLQQLLSQSDGTPDFDRDDFSVSVDLETIRPFVEMGLMQAAAEVPPEAQSFLEIPKLLKRLDARLSFSGAGPCELVAEANSAQDADQVTELIDQALQMYGDAVAAKAAELIASDDPVQQALGRYQLRVTPIWAEQLEPTRDGERFTLFYIDPKDGGSGQLTQVAVTGVLVALLLPAVQAAREAARRNSSMNNLKQIMLALLNLESASGSLPAHANYDSDGKPLLSWRVHILPYLEEQALYDQFHLDEPWDSEHNSKLIPQMPTVYLDPSSRRSTEEGRTSYLGVLGEGFLFNGSPKGTGFREIRDGTSNTIAVLQVNDDRMAAWTKPDDWELDKKKPLAGLAGVHPGTFLAGFVDGHVQSIGEDIDPEVFKQLLTIAGGEVVDLNR